jgi:hypothetical protein
MPRRTWLLGSIGLALATMLHGCAETTDVVAQVSNSAAQSATQDDDAGIADAGADCPTIRGTHFALDAVRNNGCKIPETADKKVQDAVGGYLSRFLLGVPKPQPPGENSRPSDQCDGAYPGTDLYPWYNPYAPLYTLCPLYCTAVEHWLRQYDDAYNTCEVAAGSP